MTKEHIPRYELHLYKDGVFQSKTTPEYAFRVEVLNNRDFQIQEGRDPLLDAHQRTPATMTTNK